MKAALVLLKPSQIRDLDTCEAQLDHALAQLRALDGSTNLPARAAIEWRIGRLRARREALR